MAEQDKKELFVVKILNNGLRTKDIATGEYISLKTRVPFKISELDTVTFKIEKEWIFNKHKYASGKILDNRLISILKQKHWFMNLMVFGTRMNLMGMKQKNIIQII